MSSPDFPLWQVLAAIRLRELLERAYALYPSLKTLRLRKAKEELPPWFERPANCFITGLDPEPCECCGVHTFGRTRHGLQRCVECDTMLRHAGLPIVDPVWPLASQKWLHEAYQQRPRAARDYPLEASACQPS